MTTHMLFHNDLDGIASRMIASKFKHGCTYIDTNYDKIDKEIEELLSANQTGIELVILDICPSKRICKLINAAHTERHIPVTLIDHHKTKTWVAQYGWAVFKVGDCAAKLTYEYYFGIRLPIPGHYLADFIQAVNAWDMWLLDSPHRKRGEELNSLLYFMGFDRFVSTFAIDFSSDLTNPALSYIISLLQEKIKRYVQKIIDNQFYPAGLNMSGSGNTYKIMYAEEHPALVGHAVLNHPDGADIHYAVVVNCAKNKCSLYSRPNGVDVSLLAQQLGGGGHKEAAGFYTSILPPITKNIAKILEKVEFEVEDIGTPAKPC